MLSDGCSRQRVTVARMARAPLGAGRQGPLRGVLSPYRFGAGDPTTRLADGEFWRATHTPNGPGTLHLRWAAISTRRRGLGRRRRLAARPGARPHRCAPIPATASRAPPGDHGRPAQPSRGAVRGQRHAVPRAVAGDPRAAHHRRRSHCANGISWCTASAQPAPGPNTRLRLPPAPEAPGPAARPGGSTRWASRRSGPMHAAHRGEAHAAHLCTSGARSRASRPRQAGAPAARVSASGRSAPCSPPRTPTPMRSPSATSTSRTWSTRTHRQGTRHRRRDAARCSLPMPASVAGPPACCCSTATARPSSGPANGCSP
jgi:hypothetical protein